MEFKYPFLPPYPLTYIFLNKSSNYMFPNDIYSLHKYRNLLKPFLIVVCDGYILWPCYGLYKATTSDAEIMSSTRMFSNKNSPLRRWVVEVVNGYFKSDYRLLSFDHCNKTNRTDADQVLNVINERMTLEHSLFNIVSDYNLNRRASFFDNIGFPGTYQIRQARYYNGEHVRFHGGYRIEVCVDANNIPELSSGENSLIKGKIKSRHISRRQAIYK
ncbi:hypothetical protein HW555_006476 [Spodoptera exigua]|uniref:Uncharacterized protein n=1 Tax=Spodoptera exigua TaxID=7107 RepID=A0A835L4H5_SPOEX|nr:hypothetical protein HW555_006476 [Spodoptera exigua]